MPPRVSGRGLFLPCSLSVLPPQHCRSIVRFSARLLPALHGNTTRPRCDCASDLLQHLDDPSGVLPRGSRFGLSAVCWRAACGSTLGSRARLLQLCATAGAAGCAGSSSGESMSSSVPHHGLIRLRRAASVTAPIVPAGVATRVPSRPATSRLPAPAVGAASSATLADLVQGSEVQQPRTRTRP